MTKFIHAVILAIAAGAVAAPGYPMVNPLQIQTIIDQIFAAHPENDAAPGAKPAAKTQPNIAQLELLTAANKGDKALPTDPEQLARLQQNAMGKGGITGLSTLGEAPQQLPQGSAPAANAAANTAVNQGLNAIKNGP